MVVALVTVPLLWWWARPDAAGPEVGSSGGRAADALAAAPAPAASEPAPAPPAEVSVPSVGLRAPVVGVGVAEGGQLDVPVDVATAGWYRAGPVPGQTSGSSVLVGHVNDVEQGPGAFARIAEVELGDVVRLRTESGQDLRFTVVAREQWAKSEVPLDRLFDTGGAARLVLLTCGGVFDRDSGSYEDNIAVTAVPLDRTPG
ncbi:class F sortase [Saccharomonospora xinjiangensis]|uniref:Sortase family enzyme n=1 Tax=Saccharomonospora xinjiangensis XJ-54 TaxID=882086 RepID=I0UXT6_9PSEU|nr:class F sortase [Saccharomonospora xinjiangensis]EID52689.1 sortase family enzyme [Saccharomonospora xinjiangensis XJ-54]